MTGFEFVFTLVAGFALAAVPLTTAVWRVNQEADRLSGELVAEHRRRECWQRFAEELWRTHWARDAWRDCEALMEGEGS